LDLGVISLLIEASAPVVGTPAPPINLTISWLL